jgi:hypothetical protein
LSISMCDGWQNTNLPFYLPYLIYIAHVVVIICHNCSFMAFPLLLRKLPSAGGSCKKVKQSRYRPGVAQRVPGRFPDYMTMAQDGGKVVSLKHQLPLPPGKGGWLEAESTPGPQCDQKDYANEKFQ